MASQPRKSNTRVGPETRIAELRYVEVGDPVLAVLPDVFADVVRTVYVPGGRHEYSLYLANGLTVRGSGTDRVKVLIS